MNSLPCASQSVGTCNQKLAILLQVILQQYCAILPKWPADFGPLAISSGIRPYDFVIIGSGTAGSVLASRLSEVDSFRVLLLEAGTDPPMESKIPQLYTYQQNTPYDWQFRTEPSTTASLALNNAVCKWPRGKMIGGCSNHNEHLYIRGNSRDYDDWYNLGNGKEWRWKNVLPVFIESEQQNDPNLAKNKKFHGTRGPLKVNNFNFTHEILTNFRGTFGEIGFKALADVNAGQQLGYCNAQGNLDRGSRYNAAEAYLSRVIGRPNIDVIKNAMVTTLDINAGGSVTGVNFIVNGSHNFKAVANNEVILSAGAISTPIILMNSGIGPANHLKSFNIPLVKDLAVGENLQDHLMVPIMMTLKQGLPNEYLEYLFPYLIHRTGTFADIALSELLAFYSTSNDKKYPDILYTLYGIDKNDYTLPYFFASYNYQNYILNQIVVKNINTPMVVFCITLINPKSRGRIELRSNNPLDPPKIYPNYLTIDDDMKTVIKAIRNVQQFLAADNLKAINGQFARLALPACDSIPFNSDEYWECYTRQMATTAYMVAGTTKMGPDSDKKAVVDPTLKVKGISNLRVVDAGIMPKVISGTLNAPTVMIAEKASKWIKKKYQKKGGQSAAAGGQKTGGQKSGGVLGGLLGLLL